MRQAVFHFRNLNGKNERTEQIRMTLKERG